MTVDSAQIIAKAQRLRALATSEAFKELMALVRDAEAKVFLDPTSSPEEREESHAVIRAQQRIEQHLKRAYNAETVEEHKQKDQHRGND